MSSPISPSTQPTTIDHSLTTIYYRSKEWDASKTPPSRFQKVEGSVCSPFPRQRRYPSLSVIDRPQPSNASPCSRYTLRPLLVMATLRGIRSKATKRKSESSPARSKCPKRKIQKNKKQKIQQKKRERRESAPALSPS